MKTLSLCILAGLSLSACATGNANQNGATNNGSNNGSNNTVTQYPVEAAMLNIYTKERSQKLMGTIDGQNVSAEIKVTPKGPMVFNNKKVQGAEINTINKLNNQITGQSVAINYFTQNPLVFHGFTDSSGEYSLATQTTTIPKMATIGDSSKLLTENTYTDSSMAKKIGTYNQDWSLQRDSNNTAWFCIGTSANLLLDNDPAGSSEECYKINAKGNILSSKVTISQPSNNGNRKMVFTSQ